jgi:hypothetical protein
MESNAKQWTVKGILAGITLVLLGFIGNNLWRGIDDSGREITALRERVRALEEDSGKWNLLTDLHNKTMVMETGMRVLQNDVEWLKVAVGVRVRKTAEATLIEPTATTEPLKIEVRPAPLVAPSELRRMYEQRIK